MRNLVANIQNNYIMCKNNEEILTHIAAAFGEKLKDS